MIKDDETNELELNLRLLNSDWKLYISLSDDNKIEYEENIDDYFL